MAVSVIGSAMKSTVYYDDSCGMCNSLVAWLRRRDRKDSFDFKTLQNATGCPVDVSTDPRDWSLVFEDATGVYERSDAVLRIVSSLGGLYRIALLLRIAPCGLRDSVYRWVARRRIRR